MNEPKSTANLSHGGILFPLDMFRPTMLASVIGESFIGKARNVLDATIELTRHETSPLVLMRMHGSIVGDDPALFWRENAELATMLSQMMPRQVFLYYVSQEPRRQGFIVAQQGQAIAGDDADADNMPADAGDDEWPVARLAGQLQLSLDDLASGFEGGRRIELPVVDVTGDDRELLLELAGPQPDEDEEGAQAPAGGSSDASQDGATGQTTNPSSAPATPRSRNATDLAAEAQSDAKRRASEREQEANAREALAASAREGLQMHIDELGALVAPEAELGDTDILSPFIVRKVQGDLPDGIDTSHAEALQSKRIDIVVKVEFLSEVLYEGSPLSKAAFTSHASALEIDGLEFHALPVRAPRLGPGILLRRGSAGVFVSRDQGVALPEAFIVAVAQAGS